MLKTNQVNTLYVCKYINFSVYAKHFITPREFNLYKMLKSNETDWKSNREFKEMSGNPVCKKPVSMLAVFQDTANILKWIFQHYI